MFFTQLHFQFFVRFKVFLHYFGVIKVQKCRNVINKIYSWIRRWDARMQDPSTGNISLWLSLFAKNYRTLHADNELPHKERIFQGFRWWAQILPWNITLYLSIHKYLTTSLSLCSCHHFDQRCQILWKFETRKKGQF